MSVLGLGGLVFYLALCVFLFLTGAYSVLNQLLITLVLLYIAVPLLRFLFFKERPKKQTYSNFFEKIDAGSFPSMHASRSFALLFVFHRYFNNTMISLVLLISALLICYSRLYFKKHDLIDIIGGIVVGSVTGYLVLML